VFGVGVQTTLESITPLTWYNDNIDGIDHERDMWSFKELVTGLYDRFVHSKAVGEASDRFWSATYVPSEGVMVFYHRLMRYTTRMVRPPDCYTFKTQFIMRLPKDIFQYLLDKEVTVEYSRIESILHHARRAEEKAWQTEKWHDEQHAMKRSPKGEGRKDAKDAYEADKSMSKYNRQRTSYQVTSTVKGKEKARQWGFQERTMSDTRQTKGRPSVNQNGPPKKDTQPSQLKCFGCGQWGHKSNDPKCVKNSAEKTKAAQIYAAREIVDDDEPEARYDHQEEVPVKDNEEQVEEGNPCEGSQYTSEGEEVEFNDLQDWGSSDDDQQSVCIHAMNVGWDTGNRFTMLNEDCLKCFEERELWEVGETESSASDDEEFPLLVEVSNSEEEELQYDSFQDENLVLVEASDMEDVETDTDSESDVEEVYEVEVLILVMREGKGIPPPKTMTKVSAQPMKLHKSSKILERPVWTRKETKAFVAMVTMNDQAVVVLLDSGCTTDALSPELVRVAGLKVYELKEQVPVQLGTNGSQSKINYGTKTCIKYGPVDASHYFDVVNIDRYDVILGTVFMRKHGIVLDFSKDQVRMGDITLPALCKVKMNTCKFAGRRCDSVRKHQQRQDRQIKERAHQKAAID
jgi:Aspartyl protease